MIGQVRGFDLNEFLLDWEEEGKALPWTVADGGWVAGGDEGLPGPQPREPSLVLPAPGAGRKGNRRTQQGSEPSLISAAPAETSLVLHQVVLRRSFSEAQGALRSGLHFTRTTSTGHYSAVRAVESSIARLSG